MEFQGTPRSQNNLEKEKKNVIPIPPHFKTYCKAMVIKSMVLI